MENLNFVSERIILVKLTTLLQNLAHKKTEVKRGKKKNKGKKKNTDQQKSMSFLTTKNGKRENAERK